ncbi:Helix-turn-helix domain [Nostoc flagelliforme CCNUN1]|uniref:Helix-turn-helix domain n=1 Tax=Nostoc flagelliforme CCNUN1 TaxID=2038116 RepID=A0A2K8SYK8_9NOSO|nr:Helix-turn-helix domain [Nostoc flagelliforme CCNUN1]AUB41294.1 Helix-turn-helix domain [Nostoc flagelliforme CCNUN1]
MLRLPHRVRRQSDKSNKDNNYISLSESCKILFLTESSIRYHIIRHRLKAFKSGGKWYLSKDSVETFKTWQNYNKRKDH